MTDKYKSILDYPELDSIEHCSKCGQSAIGDSIAVYKYLSKSAEYISNSGDSYLRFPVRMLRTCIRCGFSWVERTIDWETQLSYNEKIDLNILVKLTEEDIKATWCMPQKESYEYLAKKYPECKGYQD